MRTVEKLEKLRALMARHRMAAYLVVTDDFHGSEYVGDYFKEREFLSGFTGSAGTLVVLEDWAGLWTDGRYFLQAADQLAGSGIELMKSGEIGVPEIPAFLRERLREGDRLGFDGRTLSNAFFEELKGQLAEKKIELDGRLDLVEEIWSGRPALSREPVWELPVDYAGLSREEKLSAVRSAMKKNGADVLVLTALDEIAWLLNLRGRDVRCTPVFLSFMLVRQEDTRLFIHREILSRELEERLADAGVAIGEYGDIYGALAGLRAGSCVMLDGSTANCRIRQEIPGEVKVLDCQSPVIPLKAVKTPAERAHLRRAHIKDGVAVTRFIRWLKEQVGREAVTELSAAEKLEELRGEQEGYLGPSFDPIIAYGPHGAIVHYEPTRETDVRLEPAGFCLADTGGHYLEGTTDITRTIPLGPLTAEEKRAYTLVLKGHLALGAARFPHGVSGPNLDCLARGPLWAYGLDYNHGTGHGVGYLLNVHEGPQRFHFRIGKNKPAVLEEGMVISNEPGLYLENKFGIRHENLVLVCEGEKNEYGRFMYLEALTMVPFDRDAIDVTLMSDEEKDRFNAYQKKVYDALSPFLCGEEKAWLTDYTAPLA